MDALPSTLDPLSSAEKQLLLRLAREAVECTVQHTGVPPLDLAALPLRLGHPGSSFVSLTRAGELRGCVGGLEPRWPLAEDVREHAALAATSDFRFAPVQPDELASLQIEVSVLSPTRPLPYVSADDLLAALHPPRMGLVLACGQQRATFLPQVWEKIQEPTHFLDALCEKMGLAPEAWRAGTLNAFAYEVEKFGESGVQAS